MQQRSAIPMFPLSAVVFPGARLPLQIFEPRYLALLESIGGVGGRFGTCLISRGAEVGGGDQRVAVGASVVVEHVEPIGDDRFFVVVRGEARLEVVRWLDDAPYPVAEVVELPALGSAPSEAEVHRTVTAVRRARAMLSEVRDAPPLELDALDGVHEVEASWLLCAMAPLSLYDAQKLLETDDHRRRLARLTKLADEVTEMAHGLLASGGEPTLA